MFDTRTALRFDAVASGALGAGLMLLSGVLDSPLGLPMPLSVAAGTVLLAWAGFVGWSSRNASPVLVKEIITLNVAYVVLSVLFVASGWVDLTGLGVTFVLVQAGAVVALIAMQVAGLRGPTMATRALVQELLVRIDRGDPDQIADVYAEEVDWQLDWPEDEHGSDVPWIRHRITRTDVATHYREIAAHHETGRASAEISRILIDGADAVVMGTITNTVTRTGKSYRAHFALHLTVTDGLVTRHHVYEDSLAVARAWRGAEQLAPSPAPPRPGAGTLVRPT